MDPTALTGNISPTAAVSPCLVSLPPEVTENIARHLKGEHGGWGLDDFGALRLTCRELYIKTFRLYGITYFTKVSVAFTIASLRRLRDVAKYTNAFGLSLSTFPKTLEISTYRLPTGDAVQELLLPVSDSGMSAGTDAVIEAIALACKIGVERAAVTGPYNSRIQSIVHEYRKAVMEQRSIEASGYDVRSLAETMAALPNLKNVACRVDSESWGQIHWATIAGLDKMSFLNMEHSVSGKSNLTIVLDKVLQAISQVSALRRSQGQAFFLETLIYHARLERSRDNERLRCPQSVALHQIDASDYLEPLTDALSRLKEIYIGIEPYGQFEDVPEKSQVLLRPLFCSDSIERLDLDFVESKFRGDITRVTGASELLDMILATQHCTHLRYLRIICKNLHKRMEGLVLLLQTHAATLEQVLCRSAGHNYVYYPDASGLRNTWKPLLEAASRCTELSEFMLHVSSTVIEPPGVGIDIDVEGKEAVTALLAKLAVSPAEPAKELGWVK